MVAFAIGFGILWIAIAAWIYFDAIEHGKPALVWGLLALGAGWFVVPFVLYAIFRDIGARHDPPDGSARRLYPYVASVAGMSSMLIGSSIVSVMLLWRITSNDRFFTSDYREVVAGGITLAIVGAITWAITWFKAEDSLPAIGDDQQFLATFRLHRAHLALMTGAGWVGVAMISLAVLGGALTDVIGDSPDTRAVFDTSDWVRFIGPLVASLAVALFHQSRMGAPQNVAAGARAEALGPLERIAHEATTPLAAGEPAPRTQTAAAFCAACGSGVQAGDRFCRSCGASTG